MYWPIGAPNAYALSKQAAEGASHIESHDGAENDEHVESRERTAEANQTESIENEGNPTSTQTDSLRNGSVNGGDQREDKHGEHQILAAKASRGGNYFATITRSSLTVWQSKPTVALASVVRSAKSMKAYGPSIALLVRMDALIVVVQTTLGYLITYGLSTDPDARVYATQMPESNRHARKDSVDDYSAFRKANKVVGDVRPAEGYGIKEVNIRFRMVIRIDAGISKALALDDELVVATQKPAAVQCIPWVTDTKTSQTKTELISKMSWVGGKCNVVEMVHDRPMNLDCWITSDGKAYAVQRRGSNNVDMDNTQSLYQGFCFRQPETQDGAAVKAAINARFSLIAVGCANGQIDVFVVKDYMGNIPLSHQHKLSVSSSASGDLRFLEYSPDGYCLLAGYEKGWAMWSMYGKAGASSFTGDLAIAKANDEPWLCGVRDGFWTGGGCELTLLGIDDDRLWFLDIARNAITGCFAPANVSRDLLHASSSFMMYKGHDTSDVTSLSSDTPLWQSVQVPPSYLLHQWPIRSAVISPDGKYVAVAGRRGLAHYSVASGRWRTFDDLAAEHEFAVRGGMCWFRNFLIASVETDNKYQIRVFSRDKALDSSPSQQVVDLAAPAICTSVAGSDSLLVYTHDNTLMHFLILVNGTSLNLVQVGQIGFHGIIRAPPRVRSISWILPEDQLESGDPSQDVATASVLFLVDGKLVLLQPSANEHGDLKYDMRVVAQNVEYYILLRDHQEMLPPPPSGTASGPQGLTFDNPLGHSLRDSLWYFDGDAFHLWSDVQDVLACAPSDLGRDLPPTVRVPVDFYPMSAMVANGIIHGLDADLVQRRDLNFSFFRQPSRTQLFLPQLLRNHLAEYNSPAALHLSQSYQHLPYFAHALEVLLHDILDNEVDNPPSPPETALLPTAISFLSSFPCYLDVVVNCTRKTELRSWRTLFSYLPPVIDLFEQSLTQDKLKTAAGYLLVLHTFEQESFQVSEFARLLERAAASQDWELCSEVARFLVGIDSTGQTLRSALAEARLDVPFTNGTGSNETHTTHFSPASNHQDNLNGIAAQDYFSLSRSHHTGRESQSSSVNT